MARSFSINPGKVNLCWIKEVIFAAVRKSTNWLAQACYAAPPDTKTVTHASEVKKSLKIEDYDVYCRDVKIETQAKFSLLKSAAHTFFLLTITLIELFG